MCIVFVHAANIETHTVLLYSVSWLGFGIGDFLAAVMRQPETCCLRRDTQWCCNKEEQGELCLNRPFDSF